MLEEPPRRAPQPPAVSLGKARATAQSDWVPRVCWMICAAALALVGGRIAVVQSQTGEVPFLSANDRSRWATVASLVDYRTYAIDRLQNYRDPVTKRRTWQTIDRVQHRDRDGQVRNYSSKPPLLATMVAAPYAVLKSVTGLSFQAHPFVVGRLLLAIVNLPLFGLLLACLTSLTVRRCTSAWGAVFLSLAAGFGTLLTPFSISLNNHLPAAAAVAATLWLFDRQSRSGPAWWAMFAAGLATAFAVANELPALAIAPLWALVALRIGWRETLVGFVPGTLVVAALFFGTNWLAHESIRPPYAHRDAGALVASIDLPAGTAPAAILPRIAERLQLAPEDLVLSPSRTAGRARIDGPNQTWALDRHGGLAELRQWDDWYDYPGTYWTASGRRGIDLGEPSRVRYAVHALVGHHGVFSLTPLWILSMLGAGLMLARPPRLRPKGRYRHSPAAPSADSLEHPYFPSYEFCAACLICLVTVVCVLFYLARPLIDRNYGGVSVGFRWLLWMAPLWLYLAIPAVNRLAGQRHGRLFCTLLLAISLFSVSTALENPWRHPWIYRWMDDLGWIANETDG